MVNHPEVGDRVRLAYNIEDLPQRIYRQFVDSPVYKGKSLPTISRICATTGVIVEFTLAIDVEFDGAVIECEEHDLLPAGQNEPEPPSPADQVARGLAVWQQMHPEDKIGAWQITKVYLVGHKGPILVNAEFDGVREHLLGENAAPSSYQLVRQDGMLSGETVCVNPLHVQTVASNFTGMD